MEANNDQPQPTHTAYAVNRSPDYPPEWIKLGPVTQLENGHILGRFTSTPTSQWGWQWCAVPIGETPPPLSRERTPKRPPQSRPAPEKPVRETQPLPGEDEDEAQSVFAGADDNR
jgi:hypothetical protein